MEFKNRLPTVDILRGFAAVLVVLAHFVQTSCPKFFENSSPFWITMAQWAVGLFFIISGLCIHLPQIRAEKNNSPSDLNIRFFYRRRFLRLYPAHFIVLCLSAVVAAFFSIDESHFSSCLSVPTKLQFLAHIFMVHTFVPPWFLALIAFYGHLRLKLTFTWLIRYFFGFAENSRQDRFAFCYF